VRRASGCFIAAATLLAACSRPAPPTPTAEPPAPTAEPPAPSVTDTALACVPSDSAVPANAAPVPRVPLPAIATKVEEKDGNVLVTGADGRVAELTGLGLDVQPVLSPERRRVLFLRALPGEEHRRDLYLARLDGSTPVVILRDDPTRAVAGNGEFPWMTDLSDPAFFPDGKRAAFSVPDARGEVVVSVDLATKEARWIGSGFGHGYLLVPRGPYAGDLLLFKHRYYVGEPGSYDVCVLVDGRTGKEKLKLKGESNCDDAPEVRAQLHY
jgi:hypothetical protein